MAHGLVLRMQDYVKKIDTKQDNNATAKESVYVPLDETDASSVEVIQIIKSWLLVTKNSRNSKMEFLSLLRETLLFMLSANWESCTKQNDLLHVFDSYHQKFSTIIKKAEIIKNAVIQLSNDPWKNPFFQWADLALGKLTIADKNVQNYFSQEPEEIVLARVQSLVLHKNLPSALNLAKLSFLYHSRIKKNLAKPHGEEIGSYFKDSSCEGHASIDWYMTLLERKHSLSLIIKEVSCLNCHEGVEIICRLKKNQRFKNLVLALIQIFIVQDLVKPSKYCCTKNLFDLFCLIHKERNSSVKEITESIEKIFATHAPSSSHLYLLVDVMWEKFGTKFFTLYIEFCIRGLTADINYLEIAKTEEDHLSDKNELEVHIAKMLAKLSTLFNNYDEAKRDCMFSAFILKPSKSRHKFLQHINRVIQNRLLDTSENSSVDLPFRDCNCNRICNGYCNVSSFTDGFEHPLLKKGIRNVPFSLVEDLVCVLESVRCIKFQYNVFKWKFAGPKLENYFRSCVRNRNSVSSVDSSQAKNIPEKICSEDNKTSSDANVIRNKLLSPNALIKRKNSSDNSKSDFLDVGANIEVHSDDSSSKRIKISLPSMKQTQEDTSSSLCNLTINDALEKVIISSLNSDMSKERTLMSSAPKVFSKPSSYSTKNPINLDDKIQSYFPGHQSEYNKNSIISSTNFVTESHNSHISKPSIDSSYSKQSYERPSVVMKAENLSDKKYIQPYETPQHSLLKHSLLRTDLHHKEVKDVHLKSDLSYRNEHFKNNFVQNLQRNQSSQMIDRNSNNHGALNLSSTNHSSKTSRQIPHQHPLDLKCNKKIDLQKTNNSIGTLKESVSNQEIHYSHKLTGKFQNTPAAKVKTADRNSVIQHTMQHLDIKIPKNLTVSIISDNAKQKDTSNLPAFKVKVPNRSIPKHNILPANLVIPRTLPSASASAASDKASSHDRQETITIPGILAPKSVIKRSWEVPSMHSNVEIKKIVHTSSSTKKTYCHPYQKQPVLMKRDWPQELINKTEKITKKETTYQIYKTKQIPDNVHIGRWKTVGDIINSIQTPVSQTNPQLLSHGTVQSSASLSSQSLSCNSVQSVASLSNSQLMPMNSIQSMVSSQNSQLPSKYQNSNISRTASPFEHSITAHISHPSNQASISDFERPSLCSYSYKNNTMSVPNLLPSKPSHNPKDSFLIKSEQEKRSNLHVAGSHSLLKTSLLTQQPSHRSLSSQNMQLHEYTHSKALQGSNTANTSTTSNLTVNPSNLNQRIQSNLSNSDTSYSLASVLAEDDKGIVVFKAAKSEIPQRLSTSSTCCSPSEVNPCQNCSLPPEEISFNSPDTNAPMFSSPSTYVNSVNQVKYENADSNEDKEFNPNQLLLQCPSQEEYTTCPICSMSCSVNNYQFHLEKYHPFESTKKGDIGSDIVKDFDIYDYQSTSFNSLHHGHTKEMSNNILNINPLENKTDDIDLPQNQNNLNMCMNLINNSFDQVVDYLDNTENSMTYPDDSSIKFSDMLQNAQNNAIVDLENNNSTSGALDGISLENSFIGSNICGNGSSLDEMLDFLDNSTTMTQTSRTSESLKIDKCVDAAMPKNFVSNPLDNKKLNGSSKIKKMLYCKLCLKTKVRKFSMRGSIYKHAKTFHPEAAPNDCIGKLVDGEIPGIRASSSQGMPEAPDNRIVLRQDLSVVRQEQNPTRALSFNNDFPISNIEENNYFSNVNHASDSIRCGEEQFNLKNNFLPERKTKHCQSKCVYCGKLLTNIYMKQHIAKMHPNVLASKLSSNNISTSLPDKFKSSLPPISDLTQENIDSNTCLSVSDALKTGELCGGLNNTQKPGDFVNSNVIPSPKFLTSNDPLEQDLNLNNFSSNPQISFTCHLCQRPYTSQSFLTKHIKTYHGIDDINASTQNDVSYNGISDSSKLSDTNNSEPKQSLLDMPFENIPDSYGDYNYLDNTQLNTNLLRRDKINASDGYRNIYSYNCNPSSSELPTYYQPETTNVKQFLQSDLNDKGAFNLNIAAETKEDYSGSLFTTDCKINENPNFPLNSLNNSIDTSLKNVSEHATNLDITTDIKDEYSDPLLSRDCEINQNPNFLCSLNFESQKTVLKNLSEHTTARNLDIASENKNKYTNMLVPTNCKPNSGTDFLYSQNNFVESEQNVNLKNIEHDVPNSVLTTESKDEYSKLLLTTDGKINNDFNLPLNSSNNSVQSEQNVESKIVPEMPLNYTPLPRFTCRICLKTYSGKAYFRKHYKTKHNRIISDKELDACEIFPDPINSRVRKRKINLLPVNHNSDMNDLLSAQARYNERVVCKICMKVYSCRGNLKIHMKNIHNRMVSDQDMENFHKFSDLIKSSKVKKKEIVEPVNQYSRRLSLEVQKSNYSGINDLLSAEARSNEKVVCKICSKEYSCRGNLKMHMKNVHNYRGQRQRIVEGNKKEVQCHVCLKLLQNTSLKQHVQSVHGDAFLTDEQEAFTVSNVAALSALNYCAENVPNVTDSETENFQHKENVSTDNYLNSLKKMVDFKMSNFNTSQCNTSGNEVTDVSSHKTLDDVSNSTTSMEKDNKTVCNVELKSQLNDQNVVDESDFDDFSLSDIPTSDDECTNLMDSVLQKELMDIGTTSEYTLKHNEDLNSALESNFSHASISEVTETDKNGINENIMNDELLDGQPKPLSIMEIDPNTNLSSDVLGLMESEFCKPFAESDPTLSTADGKAVADFNSEGSEDIIQSIYPDIDLAGKKLESVYPLEHCKPDVDFCTTESSTDDDFNVSMEMLSDAEKSCNNSPEGERESKTDSNECRFCHKMFSTMKLLSKHLKIFHNIPFLKKQKSAKQKSDPDVKLSPPLLTQHQNYKLDPLLPSLENTNESIVLPSFEIKNKFFLESNVINKCSDALQVDSTVLLNNNKETDSKLPCEVPPDYTSNLTNVKKEANAGFMLKQHKKLKLSNSNNDISAIAQSNSNSVVNELISAHNPLDSSKEDDPNITDNLEIELSCYSSSNDCEIIPISDPENKSVPDLVSDIEADCMSLPISDQENTQQDNISKAPILPCIIKVLKNEQNAIIYQIDKSKDDSSPNSVNIESKSSPNLNRYFVKCRKSANSRNSRKNLNRNAYQSTLYSRQRSLMRRKSRTLFTRRNKTYKRSRRRKCKPVIQTFKYPNDVITFLKNHKQPVVLLTPLDRETLSQVNYRAHPKENKKQIYVRLERCDVMNIKSLAYSEPADFTDSNDRFIPDEVGIYNIPINPVMEFRRNSATQENTNSTVFHKLKIDSNSSDVPLNDDFEVCNYRSSVKSHIPLRECRVVLKKLPFSYVS